MRPTKKTSLASVSEEAVYWCRGMGDDRSEDVKESLDEGRLSRFSVWALFRRLGCIDSGFEVLSELTQRV